MVRAPKPTTEQAIAQDDLYRQADGLYRASLERLARAYELDPDKRRDLLQEIHLQLWRSFALFDGRCSLKTWVYRVAHHTATSHVIRNRRIYSNLVGLEELDIAGASGGEADVDRLKALEHLSKLIQSLKPLDRQVIVLYLEEIDATSIGEITGISPMNVAMKIHRIKTILKKKFRQGESP